VRVVSLECVDFRNLSAATMTLGPEITVMHGPNGAGKTNLLEAFHFGLTGSSFRSGPDRDLIRFDRPTARVELELELDRGRRSRLLAALERGGDRRHLLDGAPPPPLDRRASAAVFHPDRLQLLKGPPAHRRAHLDRFVAGCWPARGDLRARFGRTLAQRNALAARVRAGLAAPAGLAIWDERFAAEAEELIAARTAAAAALSAPFAAAAERLGLPEAELGYRPRAEGAAAAIAERLAELRAVEPGRSYLSYGPQSDELELRAGGRPLRRFGSQGQQRTALLALLLAERTALLAAARPAPVLLLDDVMSELDPGHRELLVEALSGTGQVLITATEPEHVPTAARAFRVAVGGGAVRDLASAA